MTEFPASAKHVREKGVRCDCAFHAGKNQIEVIFKHVFEKYAGNRVSQVLLRVATPRDDKLPDLFRI